MKRTKYIRLKKDKVSVLYSAKLNEGEFVEGSFDLLEYGWYNSGRAFVAFNNFLMSYSEAFNKLIPKGSLNLSNAFFVGTVRYKNTIDGIVRYLIEKYNKK